MPWKSPLPLGGTIPFVWGNKAAGEMKEIWRVNKGYATQRFRDDARADR